MRLLITKRNGEFFYDFQCGFRCCWSDLADILTVVSDRIARASNRSGDTWAVALNISKAFDWVWHAGHLHKLKSYGISGQIFGFIFSFLSIRQLRVVLDGNLHKNIQSILEFLKGTFLTLHFSSYTSVISVLCYL